jgi:hypothetical protein
MCDGALLPVGGAPTLELGVGGLGSKVSLDKSTDSEKQTQRKGTGDMTQFGEHLPIMHKTLSSIPSTAKKEKK